MSDRLFVWRRRFWPKAVPVDPRIQLVTVDPPAMDFLGKPELLWDGDFAEVSSRLIEAGALGVGIDFLRNPPLQKVESKEVVDFVLKQQDRMLEALVTDQVVLIAYGSHIASQRRSWPDRLVEAAMSGRNSCLANVITDADGVVRRIPFATLLQKGGREPAGTLKTDAQVVANSFALRLAELAAGASMVAEGGRWSFQSRPLELADDSLYINYPGPPGTIPAISLHELLTKRNYADFKGKLILIVPALGGDLHTSPFMLSSNELTLGGEVQASAINTVLTGRYLRLGSQVAWLTSVAAIASLVALAFAVLPLLPAFVVAVLTLAVYYLSALLVFTYRDTFLPVGIPVVGAAVACSLGLAARYSTSETSRQRVQQILGRMVSPQVATAVLRGRDVAHRQEITVLFSDINQFTPTCEKLEPEQVIVMLNAYFRDMVRIIHKYGGYVKQFVGDEIMAVFNAPEPVPNHPQRALDCALEMLEHLERLQKADPTGTGGFYSVKIGLNTGTAVVGHVGSEERSEYAAVGDDVNLAARLEALTTKIGVDILVSSKTKERISKLPPGWDWKSMGVHGFKGKTVEMEIWTLYKTT